MKPLILSGHRTTAWQKWASACGDRSVSLSLRGRPVTAGRAVSHPDEISCVQGCKFHDFSEQCQSLTTSTVKMSFPA